MNYLFVGIEEQDVVQSLSHAYSPYIFGTYYIYSIYIIEIYIDIYTIHIFYSLYYRRNPLWRHK